MSDEVEHPNTMRLQRFLARAGAASRRGSENLMTAGRVRVNGEVASELGTKVNADTDVVTVDGIVYRIADSPCYLLLNKPAGYITTMSDPEGRPCVADLMPCAEHPGLFAVGRLDRDTTGALLLTTDGQLAQQMLHPSRHVGKTYVALVDGVVTDSELEPLRRGITLDDGPCKPADVRLLDPSDERCVPVAPKGVPSNTTVVTIVLHEGRKHQVKRMLGYVGHPVLTLHRETFGAVGVEGLDLGTWREVTPDELTALVQEAGEVESR